MSETSEYSDPTTLDWYEELRCRVNWLVRSAPEVVEQAIMGRMETKWREIAQKTHHKCLEMDTSFDTANDLPAMIRTFERYAKPPCEEIQYEETAKTLQFLLGLVLPDNSIQLIRASNEPTRFSLSWPSSSLSSHSLAWLITLVVYIRSTNNLEILKTPADFAAKFNALVPKHAPQTVERKPTTEQSKSGSKPSVSPQTSHVSKAVPVSLILVFSIKHMSALQAFASNPAAYPKCADLLKQYEWAWFGRKNDAPKNRPTLDPNSANRNLCWLQLNLMTPLDSQMRPSRLKITDWIDTIQKTPGFISDAEADSFGFDLETSCMKDKGFFVK